MRYLREGRGSVPGGRWSALTGPMTLLDAERWLTDPPDDVGELGSVTMERTSDGMFVIYRLEEAAA